MDYKNDGCDWMEWHKIAETIGKEIEDKDAKNSVQKIAQQIYDYLENLEIDDIE